MMQQLQTPARPAHQDLPTDRSPADLLALLVSRQLVASDLTEIEEREWKRACKAKEAATLAKITRHVSLGEERAARRAAGRYRCTLNARLLALWRGTPKALRTKVKMTPDEALRTRRKRLHTMFGLVETVGAFAEPPRPSVMLRQKRDMSPGSKRECRVLYDFGWHDRRLRPPAVDQ